MDSFNLPSGRTVVTTIVVVAVGILVVAGLIGFALGALLF